MTIEEKKIKETEELDYKLKSHNKWHDTYLFVSTNGGTIHRIKIHRPSGILSTYMEHNISKPHYLKFELMEKLIHIWM